MIDLGAFSDRARVLLLCATLLGATQAPAQQEVAPAPTMPAPVATLFARLPVDPETWNPEAMERAIAMQMLPFAGREDLVVRFHPRAFRRNTCPALPGAPLAELAADAGDAQIVIVNEAHDQPLHRWAVRELGVALSGRFDVLAAETFGHEAVAEREAGRITEGLGSYSDEPVFGRALRALDAAGYDFVAYEVRTDQRAPEAAGRAEQVITREEAQAENLIAAVLADDPDARILVHVGYSHALEEAVNNFEREIEWFAARLKRKTGIDPLTISQTHCSLAEQAGDAWNGLRLADGSAAVEREGAIDRFLAHPPLRFEAGRPVWRRAIGDVDTPVPDALRADDQRVIIEARAPGHATEEVPVDRLLLYPGESLPLLLPPGRWRLTAWTVDGALSEPVVVEASR